MAKNGPNKAAVANSNRKSTTVFEQGCNSETEGQTLAAQKLAEFKAAEPTAKFRSSVKAYKIGPRPSFRNGYRKQQYSYTVRVYRTSNFLAERFGA